MQIKVKVCWSCCRDTCFSVSCLWNRNKHLGESVRIKRSRWTKLLLSMANPQKVENLPKPKPKSRGRNHRSRNLLSLSLWHCTISSLSWSICEWQVVRVRIFIPAFGLDLTMIPLNNPSGNPTESSAVAATMTVNGKASKAGNASSGLAPVSRRIFWFWA